MRSLIVSAALAAAVTLAAGVAGGTPVARGAVADRAHHSQRFDATPKYRVGASIAHVGDGSDPGYYAPGFSGGTGAARIGDGADPDYQETQRYLLNAPGRGGGNG